MGTLYYVSASVEDRLRDTVADNIGRYTGDGFADLSSTEGWAIPLTLQVDPDALRRLNAEGTPEAEVANSLVVWSALGKMTPALANEPRLWTRLSHVECFKYTRDRWLRGKDGDAAVKSARAHFFADTMTRRRDDHAIGRLWWNAFIARQALPGQHLEALRALLRSADIRSNVVERARTGRMPQLAGGILRAVTRIPGVTETEESFRMFMKRINRMGGGVMFQLMEPDEVDLWLARCLS